MLSSSLVILASLLTSTSTVLARPVETDGVVPSAVPEFGDSEQPDTSDATGSLARNSCPPGTTYTVFEDDFTSLNGDAWEVQTGESGVSYGSDGITLTLDPSMANTGGIVFQSREHWRAPLTLSVAITADNAPGIVHPFIFKDQGDGGDEIDLEIVQDSFQTPIWRNGVRLVKKQDFKQKLRSGTKEESAFAYTYNGFNPNEETKYKLNWETDTIAWSVGGQKRVVYKKVPSSNNWPVGPLPVRFGLWSTDPSSDWAGKLDWNANPRPTMRITSLVIKGCK